MLLRCHLCLFTLTLILPFLAAPLRAADAPGIVLKTTETSLGVLPKGARTDKMIFSADGQHLAYPIKQSDGWCVAIDGKAGTVYPWVLADSLSYSADNQRVAYVVQLTTGMQVVCGDEKSKEYREILKPVFSPDGKRLAYVAKPSAEESGQFVVLDGLQGTLYPKIVTRSLMFSPDSQHVAFVVEIGRKQRWVIDGAQQPLYDAVGRLEFSPDSARWGYCAQTGDNFTAVIDGKPSPTYARAGGLAFSPNSKRVAHAAGRGGKFFLVVDGVEGKAYDLVGEPAFSPDSEHLAVVAMTGKMFRAVLDGEEGPAYERIFDLLFTPDSKRLIYRAADEGKQFLVVDGQEQPSYDMVGRVALSPDGSRIAYPVKKAENEMLVFEGKELPGPGNATFSPNGRFVAHGLERVPKSIIMINEVEGPVYDGFLKDSKWVFESDHALTVMAARGRELLRVRIEIEEH